MKLERVQGVIDLPSLSATVDRNFRLLERTEGPYIITHSYVFLDTDAIDSLQVDATAAAVTIVLSSPTGNRRRRIIKTDASGNVVTVSAGGTVLINGATTFALAAQYKYVWVEPTGTKWLIIGSN